MSKDVNVFIAHIVESINLIELYTVRMSKEDFLKSDQIQDAVIRRLEIIGEASKKIPAAIKAQHPDIPWREMAGMRDILIHEYFGVDLELTWTTVKESLPELKQQLSSIIGKT
jgi:uncharacterized protein with HEPN domain